MRTLPDNEKKGIIINIDAGLHTEVRQYLESHGMTMAEFVTQALQEELHPKINMQEENNIFCLKLYTVIHRKARISFRIAFHSIFYTVCQISVDFCRKLKYDIKNLGDKVQITDIYAQNQKNLTTGRIV